MMVYPCPMSGPGRLSSRKGTSTKVHHCVDPDLPEVALRADTGQHQHLWCAHRSRTQHDLPGASCGGCLAADAVLHAGAVIAVQEYPVYKDVGHDVEVRAVHHRPQVGRGGVLPFAVGDVQIAPLEPFLQAAGEILYLGMSGLHCCGQACLRQWMAFGCGSHPQGTVHASYCGGASRDAREVLAALEVRQKVVVAPAVRAGLGPSVVTGPVTAQEIHGVDRRRASQPAAAGPRHCETSRGLRHRPVGPVRRRPQQRGPGRRYRHGLQRLPASRLQQKHSCAAVLRQACGDDATRRSSPYDDVVELGHGSHRSAFLSLLTVPLPTMRVSPVPGGPPSAARWGCPVQVLRGATGGTPLRRSAGHSRCSILMGSSRTRRPVAWKTALAMVAATPTVPISPIPLTPRGLTTLSWTATNSLVRQVRGRACQLLPAAALGGPTVDTATSTRRRTRGRMCGDAECSASSGTDAVNGEVPS